MKFKNIIKSISFFIVTACFVFFISFIADKNNVTHKIENFSETDINITLISDTQVQLENLIVSDGLKYAWSVSNTIKSQLIERSGFIPTSADRIISFTYEDLTSVSFRAVIEHKDTVYTSQIFQLNSDGSFYIVDDSAVISPEYYNSGTRSMTQYVSLMYILFLFITMIIYYITPSKLRWIVLLIASLFFYYKSGFAYLFIILFTGLCTYFITDKMNSNNVSINELIALSSDNKEKRQLKKQGKDYNRKILLFGLIPSLGVMLILKYSNFTISNLNMMFSSNIPFLKLLMPLGLSFYTFMVVGYIIDIYNNKYLTEKNFGKFLLFLSFFPHVSQGPISRFNDFSSEIDKPNHFDYTNICFGCQRIL